MNAKDEFLSALKVNESWYRSRYPDVDAAIQAGSIGSGQEHFMFHGYLEGRLPFEGADLLPAYNDLVSHVDSLSEVDEKSRGDVSKGEGKLVIHIGHGKTGSSFIQSVLALNSEKLARAGVIYPEHESAARASAGLITSGNGSMLLGNPWVFEPGKSYLYSNESLVSSLLIRGSLARIVAKSDRPVKVLLYTRNVFEVLFSGWGQWVKRGGSSQDIDSFLLADTSNMPFANVAAWLDAADRYGFELVVRNYSNCKSNLMDVFLADVFDGQMPDFEVEYPKVREVNRSLTHVEYEIQRIFNRHLTKTSGFVSDALVEGCPEIKASALTCKSETYDVVRRRLTPLIEKINQRLPDKEKVQFEDKSKVVSEDLRREYSIGSAQIEVLVAALSEQLRARLHDEEANYLRDIAENIAEGQPMGLPEALQLMALAKKARPASEYIVAKVEEWEKRLKDEKTS